MRPLNIGEMRDRLQVFRQTKTADGIGGFQTAWELENTIWGKIEEENQNRALNVGQISYQTAYKITIRTNKQIVQPDFSSDDFHPGDFETALTANRFSENYKIRHEGRDIVLHSVLERKRWTYVILGYCRTV